MLTRWSLYALLQVEGASMGPQRPGWKDHYFRVHPSARAAAAKAMAKRNELIKENEEKRKLMTVENKYGAGYYYGGESSSEWVVNGVSMNYADVDCDYVPGWFQKLDNFPATNWKYPAGDPLAGFESVCAGETTPQDPSIPGALPTIPCALICLPYQAGVSSAATQTGTFMMPAETATSGVDKDHFAVHGTTTPAAPLKLAQKGYDTGYLGYGYAAPDPFGGGPICDTYIKDCTYSTESTRTFTKGGQTIKYPRHDPVGFGRATGDGGAADGVCSKSDSATQWLDCGIPCPAPYPMSQSDLAGTFGPPVLVFIIVCTLLGLLALIRVGKKAENYFVAGRSLNLFVITATLGSQSIDSGTALGTLDLGYLYHWWDGACIPIGIGLSLWLNSVLFAQPLNRMKLMTLPDLMARKFGPACEILFSLLSIASFLCLLGGNLVGAGKIISHLFFNQENEIPGIWICSFCVWLYTVTGGLFSVAYTDIGQALIGWTGMLAGAIYIMANFPSSPPTSPAYPLGDVPAVPSQMTDKDALDPIPNAIVLNWATLVVLAFGNLGALDFQARVFAAKTPRTAAIGCFIAGTVCMAIGTCFAFIPGATRALYGPSSPHAEFVADSCSRHITVLACFGPGKIDTNPANNPGCTGSGITGCDPKIRTGLCNAIPMNTPTCGEWKPDKYAPLKMLTCYGPTCNAFTDYLGDSGVAGTFPGFVGNYPMPAFLGGWMLLAIIAASMSTGDGSILALGTVLGHNIMGKFKTNYSLLTVTRWSTILWAIISAGIASLVPGKTGYLLIVAFDIMLAGTVIPMIAAVYFPKAKPNAVFYAMVAGSLTRFIFEFALQKDSLLLAVGTYAETFDAGLYDYADFKKFTNWDVVVGAQGATDYAATGKQEACPQRPLNDWTGLDSMLSPVVCLLTLLICQFALPNSDHPWFTPNPNAGDPEEAETSKDKETAMA